VATKISVNETVKSALKKQSGLFKSSSSSISSKSKSSRNYDLGSKQILGKVAQLSNADSSPSLSPSPGLGDRVLQNKEEVNDNSVTIKVSRLNS